MLKINIKYILIAVILISCNTVTKESNEKKQTVEIINLREIFKREKKVNLSEIALSIEYIQLESNDVSLLNRIKNINKDIQFSKKNIVIKDASNNLILFDYSGKFLKKIGNVGKGPQEYPSIQEFTVFKEGNEIAVHSAQLQKVLVYNNKGEFLNSFKTGFWSVGMTSFQQKFIFMNPLGRRNYTDYFTLSSFSKTGNKKKSFLYKSKEKEIEIEKKKKLNMFTTLHNNFVLNDTLRYWESSYGKDTIWSVTKENKEIPSYVIDFDDNLRPYDLFAFKKNISFEEMIKYGNVEYFQESSNYMFFKLYSSDDKKLHKVLYNKKTKISTSILFKKSSKKGFNFSFYNNIDGGMPFWPEGKVSDDKMYMLLYGYELKDYVARQSKELSFLDKKGRSKLLNIVKNAKISDNPILMVVTLKK